MLITALSHALISIIIALIGLFFGNIEIGIAIALSFYLGREVAQHERKTPGTNPLRGFYFWNWSLDSGLDIVLPIIACGGLYALHILL